MTDEDGQYELDVAGVGDGVLPGEYDVVVNELRYRNDKPVPPSVSLKYINSRTSGLKFTVEPGGERSFNIVLDPP